MLFLVGAVMLILGMGFFRLGAEMAMIPIGEGIGVQISKTKRVLLITLIGFVMGVIITVSEPDLQVLAEQVPAIPNLVLILAEAENKTAIMQAISGQFGTQTKAKGLVLSLPIDSVMGI